MAAGDLTINADSKNTDGKFHKISGTAEVDTTLRAFDLFPGGYVHSFVVTSKDAVAYVQVILNEDASSNADPGSVAMDSSASVGTFDWTATYTS
tara:strand:+ start:440 stop:721 length:282 start_codon:yes stop_codon:yes gene_type:complete